MFFYVLFAISESHKTICICNGECDPQCKNDFYNVQSTNVSFNDFLYTILDKEQQITLDFYSRENDFIFPLDSTKFGNAQITLRTLSQSEAVQIEIKQKSKQVPRTIKIEPNYQVILPNLISFPIPKPNKPKNALSSDAPSIIPISVPISKMKHYGSGTCNKKTASGGSENFVFNENTEVNINEIECKYDNLDSPAAYDCGIRCWGSNLNYSYTFKGEKFLLYGTNCSSNFQFDVELDGKIIASPDEHLDGNQRQERVVVYESKVFEYNEHTVRILSKGKTFELYKLAYYPSVRAKRINSTHFNKVGDNWKSETDGIGGVRHYRETNGGEASIKLNCMKFWLYGIKDDNLGLIDMTYDGTTKQINPYCPHEERREGALLYESPELNTFDITLSLKVSSQTMFIYCLYFIEPPTPLSVALFQMQRSSIDNCAYYTKDGLFDISTVGASTSQDIGCPKTASSDLSAASSYKCGIKCWGKSTYTYKFKGVKFALYGTFNSGHGSFKIYLDDSEHATVNQGAKTIDGPSLLYESTRLIYKEHEIKIQSNNDNVFEFYKLAYWPSLRVDRANCTQFKDTGNALTYESDGIGGLRKFIYQSGSRNEGVSIYLTCSRFWFYSMKDQNDAYYKEVRFRFHYMGTSFIDKEITAYTASGRTENTLLYESPEFAFNYAQLLVTSYYALIVNCVYYTYAPSITEYINKTFLVTLPYFDIHVPGNSVTNQISGCTFSTIQEEIDIIIRLEKEVAFFDNIFDYPFTGGGKCTIQANYTGNLVIKNCTFINARCKSDQEGNVFHCGSYSMNVFFDSCIFNNCGNSKDQVVIKISGGGSSLSIKNCSISFYDNVEPARVIDSN